MAWKIFVEITSTDEGSSGNFAGIELDQIGIAARILDREFRRDAGVGTAGHVPDARRGAVNLVRAADDFVDGHVVAARAGW